MTVPPVRLHVERLVDGDSSGAPLVLLHGFTGDATTWSRLVPYVGDERPVWAVDLVGHGRSGAPDDAAPYTMPAAVAQVLAAVAGAGVIRGTEATSRAHWLGYSMGGRLALHLALAHPEVVASLVLVGASPGLTDPTERAARLAADEELARFIEREGVAAFVERWMAQPLFATQARLGPEYLAAARRQRRRNRPAALARSLRGMGTGAMEPVVDRLGEIRAPTLVVTGEDDAKFGGLASRMVDRLPAARLLIVPGSGHAVHVEAPEVLGGEVRRFLHEVD